MLQPPSSAQFTELHQIWSADPSILSLDYRIAWAAERNIDPMYIHTWYHRHKNDAADSCSKEEPKERGSAVLKPSAVPLTRSTKRKLEVETKKKEHQVSGDSLVTKTKVLRKKRGIENQAPSTATRQQKKFVENANTALIEAAVPSRKKKKVRFETPGTHTPRSSSPTLYASSPPPTSDAPTVVEDTQNFSPPPNIVKHAYTQSEIEPVCDQGNKDAFTGFTCVLCSLNTDPTHSTDPEPQQIDGCVTFEDDHIVIDGQKFSNDGMYIGEHSCVLSPVLPVGDNEWMRQGCGMVLDSQGRWTNMDGGQEEMPLEIPFYDPDLQLPPFGFSEEEDEDEDEDEEEETRTRRTRSGRKF
ncbi:hypothetical protein GGX14DRAFT_447989 [Mycena pura]|uniref:Uncharacterized protein n=1 Tax=Mycena pura TaxID=153505 RepID=A0AAD6VGJ5_9AGAR|nr:hypothetical protein GGX14DRAFT_447989 [Mycena pura]